MISNPKTTLAGYLALGVILLYVAYGFYTGQPLDLEHVLGLIGAGALGAGLIGAKDGGR